MADKGIIFSAEMVRALLDGRKTQTRRLCAWANNPSSPVLSHIVPLADAPGWFGDEEGEVCFSAGYQPGQRLYVREAWHVRGQYSDVVEVGYRASENRGHTEYVEQVPVEKAVPGKGKWPEFPKYGPSIHMPRWASRMTLLVTDVRVQRLQDCSEADAIAEGVERIDDPRGTAWKSYETYADGTPHPHAVVPNRSALTSYAELWSSLHTTEGERWADNPWVVAISFEVRKVNIDEVAQ